jgi:hypothetical protein
VPTKSIEDRRNRHEQRIAPQVATPDEASAAEVDEVVGPKGRHNADRRAKRHGRASSGA